MSFEQEFLQHLREYAEGKRMSQLAEQAGVDQSSLSRAIGEKAQKLGLDKVSKVLDALGAYVVFPGEGRDFTREVCFVDRKIVPVGEHAPPPADTDYVAVPLVGEVGAGPGMVAEDDLKSWVLVYRNLASVARRTNLLAVEIGKNQRSMVPLLHPGDIVLVDLDDKGDPGAYRPPGNIFLVREPGQEGGGKIKRVSLSGTGQNTILTFYSENVQENEPEPYFLGQDYDNDISRAIVGKVVWAWTDLSRK